VAKKDGPPTWSQAVDQFIAWMRVEEKSELTMRNYSDDLRVFASWYEAKNQEPPRLAQLTKGELVEWKHNLDKERKLAPQTVNRKLAAAGSFLKWAKSEELCQAIGTPKKMRCGRQPPKWLERNDKNALLRAVKNAGKPHHLDMVTLLLNTGLRVSELASLKWTEVKMTERKGTIEVEGKGRKQRIIPLNPDAINALKGLGWKDHKGKDRCVIDVTVRGIQFIVEKYGRRAELDELTVHMLRHTFAHDLLTSGVALNVVSEILGHESIVTTALYVAASEKEMKAAVDRISAEADDPDDEPDTPPVRPNRRRRR
jgi:site-specific recombinase XerD